MATTGKVFKIKPKAAAAAAAATVEPEIAELTAAMGEMNLEKKKVFKIRPKVAAEQPTPWWPVQKRIPITQGE